MGSYRVEADNDGVYLVIETPRGGEKPPKDAVMKYLDGLKVRDLDFAAISEAFKNPGEMVKVKISSDTNVQRMDERAIVEVARDKMEASITFEQAGFGGRALSEDQIIYKLTEAGVTFGVNKRLLQALAAKKEYGHKFAIAAGRRPVDGEAGRLEFKFDSNPKTKKPKIREDGRVDFKDLDAVETAYAGQTLVVAHPPTAGTEGMTVTGEPITPKPGKPTPKLPKGKNTRVNEEETELTSELTGQLSYDGGKVNVNPVLTIADDVGPTTGNIDFAGDVLIKGSVKTGYSVKAAGFIEVQGTVEGAEVIAKGELKIYGGVQGNNAAVVKAGGHIFMRYAEAASITSGGNIVADSILHCKVLCGGHLRLEGRKCVIVGGEMTVARWIRCNIIGSVMSGETAITTGHAPNMLAEFESWKRELETMRTNFTKSEQMAEVIMKQGDIKSLPKDKKEMLIKIIHSKAFYAEKINSINAELAKLSQSLSSTTGEIYVADKIFSGAKITIGNALMMVRDDINRCTLRNSEGKIIIGMYVDKQE